MTTLNATNEFDIFAYVDDIVLIGDNHNEIKLLTELLLVGDRFTHNSRYPDDYRQQKCGTSQLDNVHKL